MRLHLTVYFGVISALLLIIKLLSVPGLSYAMEPNHERDAAVVQVTCPGATNPMNSEEENLDHTELDWGVYCEQSPEWVRRNVPSPSVDGESLECGITGGIPYSNVHCYRNLLSEPDATMFTMDLSFWFDPTTCNNLNGKSVVQALEFTMNKWYNNQRFEFAIQWQNVGDGGPQWRYWDPNMPVTPVDLRWSPFNPPIKQCLLGGNSRKHTLRLEGSIVNGQVDLRNFVIDSQEHTVNLFIDPVSDAVTPPQLALAVQVDGNSKETPYSLFVDQFHFIRWPTLLTLNTPSDGSTVLDNSPTVSWNPIPEAVQYELQIDTVNPPTKTVAISSATSYTPPNPLPDAEYFWRVRAIDAANHMSPWTRSSCLRVQSPLKGTPIPNLFSTDAPTLTWSYVNWASEYEIQIDDSPLFVEPLEYVGSVQAPALTTTIPYLHDCTHYWRVRAKGSNGTPGQWSATNIFTLDAP